MAPSSTMGEDRLPGSPVTDLYKGATVLVTGATGFMGKVLVEKLLRTCSQVAAVYLIVRPKKGTLPQKRLQDMLQTPLFAKMREEHPKWESKVVVMEGDCSVPGLGTKAEDRALILENVNIVFHGAATVRFDESLKTAVTINIKGIKHMLELAKEMKQLKALIHISTAYANCPRDFIEEVVYQSPMSYSNLIKVTDSLDDTLLDKITPVVLDPWPNTYVYTKQIAEEVVTSLGKGLPVAIFRPGIVVCSQNEPLPGWTDNLNGASGIMVGSGTGVLRTLQCNRHMNSDIVPVDLAVNAMIAAAWKTASRFNENNNQNEVERFHTPEVYNFVSSTDNPVTWDEFVESSVKHAHEAPPLVAMWYICLAMHTSRSLYKFKVYLLHLLPALVIDTVASFFGKNTNMLKIQKKVQKYSDILAYFTLRQWQFKTNNVRTLWKELNTEEKLMFPFDIKALNWDDFFKNYTRGLRQYVLNEDPSTIEQARTKMRRFYWLHQILKIGLYYCVAKLSWFLLSPLILYMTN